MHGLRLHWKPMLCLALLSPVLTEVLSGNTPIPAFIRPLTLLLFVTIGYGIPVLIIRELYVRLRLGLVQLLILGFCYGIYNEGLFARTIFSPFHSPADSFTNYGLMGTVRVPWLLSIGTWHSLYAVVFPILLIQYFFPSHAASSWISKKAAFILAFVCLAFGTLDFLGVSNFPESGGMSRLLFILILWVLLWVLARVFPRLPKIAEASVPKFSWKNLGLGIALFVFAYFLPVLFSGFSFSSSVFVLYYVALFSFTFFTLRRKQQLAFYPLLLVALGGEIALSVFSFFIAIAMGAVVQMFTVALFLCIFLWLALRIRKRSQTTPAPDPIV